ncbi:MAG: hypothetical protein ACXAC6_07525 [Candidatus Hodarchaeales archaeon]|jgi:hypothetical protein
MSLHASEEEKRGLDNLQNILSSIKTTGQVRPEISEYTDDLTNRLLELTNDYYASLVYLFTSPLSLHQRLILMRLISIYPKGSSGIDLARNLGISEKSKSIYRDLKLLSNQHLVSTDEIHSRLKLIYANPQNRFVNRLIELVQIHGQNLGKILEEQ